MPEKSGPQRYEFIDALRGLAFLGVLVHHLAPQVAGVPESVRQVANQGHEGVELFFLCSAMTLFLSMTARRQAERRPTLNYFIRRFFRIAPLFYLGILGYGLLASVRGTPEGGGGSLSWGCILTTLTFTNGWTVPWINRLVPGGWSIAVEMNFYLLVPLFFRRIKTLEQAVRAATATLLVGGVASVLVRMLTQRAGFDAQDVSVFSWYWLPAQLPIFCLGFALFFLVRPALVTQYEDGPGARRRANLLLVIALFLIVTVSFSRTAFYLGHALFGVAFLLMGWSLALNPNRLIVNPVIRQIGVVSFSAYLTHFFILELTLRGVAPYLPSSGSSVNALVRLSILFVVSLGGTVAVSMLTYRGIEVPGQKIGKALIQRLEAAPTPREPTLSATKV